MSRTLRRKNATHDLSRKDYAVVDKHFQTVWLNFDSKEYIHKKAKFHSDSYFCYSVPRWFVNVFFERPNRRKTKKEIKKWLLNDEHEIILDRNRKSAKRLYW